ncbi:MAG: pitrilysin family protein, partial [Bacteroidota bacterium]|nr:pitrilysin family protein [Bacteroidota bacterium]
MRGPRRHRYQHSSATTQVQEGDGTVFRMSTLPSGLRLVTEEVPSVHSVAIGVWIDTGSRDETPEENGISHFIEHSVFKGTHRRRTHHIAQYLEAVGGYLNAFTTKDTTCFYARVLAPHLPRAVHLLADIIQNPVFPPQEIEKEKQVIIEELRGAEDDAEDLVHESFEQLLYGRHPLGQSVLGREQNITAFTRDDLLGFVHRHYATENIVIAAAGAVDHDTLAALCAEEFHALPRGEAVRRVRPRKRRARSESRPRPVQQTHLVIGSMTEGYHGRDRHAITVLNALLGEGMSSRLFQRLRERYGYAYNIYSFYSMYHDATTFGVYAGLESGQTARARGHLLRELNALAAHPVSMRELNRAREQVVGSMLMSLESMTNRMSRLGRDALVFGHDIPVRQLVEAVHAVSAEDIRALAPHLVDPERLVEMRL